MKLSGFLLFLLLISGALAHAVEIDARHWELTDDHFPQAGVPRGQLEGPFEFHSDLFEGTVRRYWVFVPAQYDAASPAHLLVFQDGQRATHPNGSLRVPQVLANLIAKGDIPVTIGVFVTPGNHSAHYPDNLAMSNPDNRAAEYDALSDRYARFLIDELLPEVAARYNLSSNPRHRAIGGTSSGAICAFTVAWHRPDVFQNVLSFIGSYVSIGFRPDENPPRLGGQDYPALIRREAIRPLKIFLQDGANDLDNEWGNWFLANQQMVAAFNYANRSAAANESARYELRSIWTNGEHSDNDGGAMLPDALRWLWSD